MDKKKILLEGYADGFKDGYNHGTKDLFNYFLNLVEDIGTTQKMFGEEEIIINLKDCIDIYNQFQNEIIKNDIICGENLKKKMKFC